MAFVPALLLGLHAFKGYQDARAARKTAQQEQQQEGQEKDNRAAADAWMETNIYHNASRPADSQTASQLAYQTLTGEVRDIVLQLIVMYYGATSKGAKPVPQPSPDNTTSPDRNSRDPFDIRIANPILKYRHRFDQQMRPRQALITDGGMTAPTGPTNPFQEILADMQQPSAVPGASGYRFSLNEAMRKMKNAGLSPEELQYLIQMLLHRDQESPSTQLSGNSDQYALRRA